MANILAFFGLLRDLWGVISQAIALFNKARVEGWVQDGQAITKAIQNAKTDDERRALVKRLADNLRNTP